MPNIPIIASQFAPPAGRVHDVSRRLLNKKLRDIPAVPLTLVHAGAGYGKSTALASFAADFSGEVCWYTLSKRDDDVIPFLTKMAHAVKRQHPLFGEDFMHKLSHLEGYVGMEDLYTLASAFINDIMRLEHTVIIILDDFHHASNSGALESWMQFLLEHRPDNLHMVLSTRKKPQWGILAAMMVKGDLLEIPQSDLLLDSVEMQFILEDIYELHVNETDISNMYERTEGWAIAFNLLAQQLASGHSPKAVFESGQSSLKDLFDYLAQEVLAKQPAAVQTFLLRSSVLDVMTAESCDAVLEIGDSAALLADLAERNLFIARTTDNVYRYHALFKAFLEDQLYRTAESDYDALHQKAAAYYSARRNPELVIYHHQKCKNDEAVARLLSEHGASMIQAGRLQTLHDLLRVLPDAYKQMYPALYFFQGEIERYWSSYEAAETCYEHIIRNVPEDDPQHYGLMGMAFEGKARIYLDTIQPDKAEWLIKQAISMQEKAGAPKTKMGKLYLLMAENLLNSGYANKAGEWLKSAEAEGLPLEESNLQARILLRTGKLADAKATLEKQKERAPVHSRRHLPQAHRETDILLSLINAFMGEAEASKEFAEAGLNLGLDIQSPFVEACGWMRMGHAVQMLDRYDHKLARKCYVTALDIMETINVSRGKAEPHMGLSILYATRLQFDKAFAHAREGLKETEMVKDRWLSALNKIGMGMIDVYRKDYGVAKATFQDVLQDIHQCEDRYGLMVSSFWLALIAFRQQNDAEFDTAMAQFLTEMEAGQYTFFLTQRTLFGPIDLETIVPLLLEGKQRNMAPDFLRSVLEELNIDETRTNHPGYTLVIDTFGGLSVRIGKGEKVPRPWQREKAKELLGLLITNRDRLLMRSDIYQALWPDEPEEAANAKFKVAFNALLKTVEPNRKARAEPFFISREGSGYRLHASNSCMLDVVQFEEKVNAGLAENEPRRAKTLLETGLALYQGEYLADLRGQSWSQAERDRLQLLYLHGAEKMARIHVRLLDFTACITWCERILALDQTWEEAYRLIMYSYYQKNNRPQAIQWYERCCHILKRELGVDPMAPTQDMYYMIMESEQFTIE